MPVKAVLSDLGGVLIDFSLEYAIAEWARLAGVEAGVIVGNLVVDEAWEGFEVGRLRECEFWSHVRRQCDLNLTDEELIAGWNSVFIGVNHEVERLLRNVAGQGTRVVAVTNTNVTHQRVWRERYAGNLDFFGAVYSSCETGARKPEPAFFEHVLESEGIAPRDAVFIDDLQVNVAGAIRLGLDAVLYTGAESLRDAFVSRGLSVRRPTE